MATVPAMARTHPFVMRGILAEAAVHLSWLRPAQKAHYTTLAAKHHSLAIPEFRSAMATVHQGNYRALVEYAFTLVWCSFAWFDAFSARDALLSDNWLPNWFHLLRGACLVVSRPPQAKYGPSTADESFATAMDFLSHNDFYHLSMLELELLPLVNSPISGEVLAILKHSFALASMRHVNTPLRLAMNFWVGSLPDTFIDLLHKKEPWSLVVLAHFAILVKRSETRWFMQGHGLVLYRLATEPLSEYWTGFLRWPSQEFESYRSCPAVGYQCEALGYCNLSWKDS